jgi:coenzyme F420-reducing hydrogenase gamma subunit
MAKRRRPKLAVFKFASCDGCQLSLLDLEDELLAVASELEIAHFLEASRATIRGPYDLSLVEGSVTTAADAERIREVRKTSKVLVTIGACATSAGVQALRNFVDVREYASVVYARPDYVATLATSSAIRDNVRVDFELRGCPVNKLQLLEVLSAYLNGRAPNVPEHAVCLDCKRSGTVCVMVARGVPCLGPVTHTGCGVLCPRHARGCYGCFGPSETPDVRAVEPALRAAGATPAEIGRSYGTFNVGLEPFRSEYERLVPLRRREPRDA